MTTEQALSLGYVPEFKWGYQTAIAHGFLDIFYSIHLRSQTTLSVQYKDYNTVQYCTIVVIIRTWGTKHILSLISTAFPPNPSGMVYDIIYTWEGNLTAHE